MPAVPMPRPSSSSDARYSTECFRSTWKFGSAATAGAGCAVGGRASARAAGELQASGRASNVQRRTRIRGNSGIGPDCMAGPRGEQTTPGSLGTMLQIGVDVGGTFTDLVAFDGETL